MKVELKLTDDQINYAIAERLGWSYLHEDVGIFLKGYPPSDPEGSKGAIEVPDFLDEIIENKYYVYSLP